MPDLRLRIDMPRFESLRKWPVRVQSGEMRTALEARYEREADLTMRWEAGEATEALGEQKRTDYETHQADLALILTPEQLATYRSRRGGGGK